jgi:hypothetical protein
MKIDTTRLTPLILDQYSNQENRLTHALMHTLAGSVKILRCFLKEVQGIKFRKGFGVETAKAILMSEMEALQDTAQAIFPNLKGRRGAITTALSKSSVWDCFGLPEGFTNDIHITLSIKEDYQDISLTVPHKAGKRWKRLKHIFGNEDEFQEFLKILKVLRKNVPDLFLEYIQRHFLYQRRPVRDAFLEFHIDTFGPPFFNRESKVKMFPIWFEAIKDAVVNKRKINAQVMFKARFYYAETEDIEQASFLQTAQQTLNNLKPLYAFLLISA